MFLKCCYRPCVYVSHSLVSFLDTHTHICHILHMKRTQTISSTYHKHVPVVHTSGHTPTTHMGMYALPLILFQPGLTERNEEHHFDRNRFFLFRSVSMSTRTVAAEGVYHVLTGSLCMRGCLVSRQNSVHMEVANAATQGGGHGSSGVSLG